MSSSSAAAARAACKSSDVSLLRLKVVGETGDASSRFSAILRYWQRIYWQTGSTTNNCPNFCWTSNRLRTICFETPVIYAKWFMMDDDTGMYVCFEEIHLFWEHWPLINANLLRSRRLTPEQTFVECVESLLSSISHFFILVCVRAVSAMFIRTGKVHLFIINLNFHQPFAVGSALWE